MRKYDIKNKRNIGIIIVISVVIIIMFSLVINLFLGFEKKEYNVDGGTLVFDKDKTIIKVLDSGVIKNKWNNDYYLLYKDEAYELGNTAIAYNENTGEIYLYGRYYEIGSGDEVKVTSDETVIKNSTLTKFYKLADRKYLVIDKEIKSTDGLISTSDFLMVDLDKVGNATLTNHKVSLKTFSETEIVTANYTFDIANEILTYGSDFIDLKKIIGSTNTYTKEDLLPEENEDNKNDNGITNVTDNSKPDAGGNGGNQNSDTVIEEIKKESKNTSIVSVNSGVSTIDIDYVIYDPYNEYTSVYMEIMREGSNSIETIHLNSNSTNYVVSNNVFPNSNYMIVFKCTYVDPETGLEVRETIDEVNVTTKLPSVGIKVTSTSFGRITYQITTDNSFVISSGVLSVYVNDNEFMKQDVLLTGNKVDTIDIPNVMENDKVELKLTDIKSGDVIIKDLNTSYTFRY